MIVVTLARKPFSSSVADCVQEHGAGGIRVDGERRYPANMVLEHLDGCELVGRKRVKVIGCGAKRQHGDEVGVMGWQCQPHDSFRDADGMEEVDDWLCELGCPVAGLDESKEGHPSRFFQQFKIRACGS